VPLLHQRKRKKKVEDEALEEQGIIDPLANLEIDMQCFDIPRLLSVYSDQGGINWWAKAWFNNRSDGEAAVSISKETALQFWHDEIEKETMLEEYFPKPMQAYHQAIEQTKQQLIEMQKNQQQVTV